MLRRRRGAPAGTRLHVHPDAPVDLDPVRRRLSRAVRLGGGRGILYVGSGPRARTRPRVSASAFGDSERPTVAAVLAARRPRMLAGGEAELYDALAAERTVVLRDLALLHPELALAATTLDGLGALDLDAPRAADSLRWAASGELAPADHPFIRRHLPALRFAVVVGDGLEWDCTIDRGGLLLAAGEALSADQRPVDAAAVLAEAEPGPARTLMRATALISAGQPDAAIAELDAHAHTLGDDPSDPWGAAGTLARARALLAAGDPDGATAVVNVLADREPGDRAPAALVAAALVTRAAARLDAGDVGGAGDDLRRLADHPTAGGAAADLAARLGAGRHRRAGPPPSGPPASPSAPSPAGGGDLSPRAVAAARARLAPRPRGEGVPGHWAGRHHTAFCDEVDELESAGLTDAAEDLLVGLIDAAEDEVSVTGTVDPRHHLRLAELARRTGRPALELAALERLEAVDTLALPPEARGRLAELRAAMSAGG